MGGTVVLSEIASGLWAEHSLEWIFLSNDGFDRIPVFPPLANARMVQCHLDVLSSAHTVFT